MFQAKLCQNYLSGFCLKGSSCPFRHQKLFSDNKKNFLFNNDSKIKKIKKKNFFEDLEDIPLKSTKYFSQTQSQKISDLDKEFSNFDLFNDIKDKNGDKIHYCKNFLENKCIDRNCGLYHGYNNNLKNITRIFNYYEEKVIKILLINKVSFITATKYIIRIYSIKDKFKCKGEIEVNEFDNKTIEIQNIFCFDKILFSCEYNSYNKLMSIVMRFENFKNDMQKLSTISGNQKVGEIIFLKNESLILCFGDIYLEMFRTDVANKKIERIQKIQVEKNYGFSSVILFNKEFICSLKNGVIGILTPNKEGTQLFTKRLEIKHHEDEITKLLLLEIDSQTHYFISGSLDKTIKLFNYEKKFSLIFSKNLGELINNLFLSKDYNKDIMTMASLITGIIKVLDDKFNEIFDIRGPDNKNIPRFGIDIYLEIDNNIYEDDVDEEENGNKGNYLILNFGKGIEINKWTKEK
jgi:WD40 repeat protein